VWAFVLGVLLMQARDGLAERGSISAGLVHAPQGARLTPLFESFEGMNGSDNGAVPPDVTIAAGPYQIVEVVNGRVSLPEGPASTPFLAIFRKNGTAELDQPITDFFGNSTIKNAFDPQTLYDPYINRFWIVASMFDETTHDARLFIALSDSADANAAWHTWMPNVALDNTNQTNNFCDYPQLGIDAQAIYITCDMASSSTPHHFQYAKARVMTKQQFLDNQPTDALLWWDFTDLREGFLTAFRSTFVQPAVMRGAMPADGEFLIDAHGGGDNDHVLEIWHITSSERCCIAGAQSAPTIVQHDFGVHPYGRPPDAQQPDNKMPIDTGNSALQFAFWRDGILSTGQTTSCGPPIIGPFHSCVAFTELDVSAFPEKTDLVNDWVFQKPEVDYYYPAAEVNSFGERTLVFTRSDPGTYPSAEYLLIPPNYQCRNCTGPELLLKEGSTSYEAPGQTVDNDPRNAWGDYLGASPDPDGVGIWVAGEYALSADTYGTRIGLTQERIDRDPPRTAMTTEAISGGIRVTLSSRDDRSPFDRGSGVRFIQYTRTGIGTVTVWAPSATFSLTTPGRTTVYYHAQDNWGNAEREKSQTVDVPAASAFCVVPRLTGKTVRVAKRTLKTAHCTLGNVTKAYSRRIARGLIIRQRPAAGAKRPNGAGVSVVVSRGRMLAGTQAANTSPARNRHALAQRSGMNGTGAREQRFAQNRQPA
jgi:PASTA domain